MNLVRNEPWGLLNQLHNEIGRAFGQYGDSDSTGANAAWIPAVDIHETGDRFFLYVDVPGVDPAQVEITLENGVLTLSGERREAKEANGNAQRRIERPEGRFHRRFILPDTVDADNVQARSNNGVLEITVPKQPKVQPRRIQVNA